MAGTKKALHNVPSIFFLSSKLCCFLSGVPSYIGFSPLRCPLPRYPQIISLSKPQFLFWPTVIPPVVNCVVHWIGYSVQIDSHPLTQIQEKQGWTHKNGALLENPSGQTKLITNLFHLFRWAVSGCHRRICQEFRLRSVSPPPFTNQVEEILRTNIQQLMKLLHCKTRKAQNYFVFFLRKIRPTCNWSSQLRP